MPRNTNDFAYREALNYVNGYLRMQSKSNQPLTPKGINILLAKVEAEYGIRLTKEVLQ